MLSLSMYATTNLLYFLYLQIHDGPNSTSPAFPEQPRYYHGSWTRPVIAATSKYVFLKFIPGPTKGKTFVGFKASYWTVQSKYRRLVLFFVYFVVQQKLPLSWNMHVNCAYCNFSVPQELQLTRTINLLVIGFPYIEVPYLYSILNYNTAKA